jgi:hypothetical protein
MYKNHLSNYKYDGCVLIFGGDMIEQALHGAEETNDLSVVDQVIKATQILINVVLMLKEAFGKVSIFAVSGNHGRLIADKFVKNYDRLSNSLEKIIYYFISDEFEDDPKVTLNTSETDVLYFTINNLRFRLEHGDTIKFTGQAISGPLNTFTRAYLKRHSVDSNIGMDWDILMIGHFHHHLVQSNLIVMDSIKGYDSYSHSLSLPFSHPGVTTFAINSHGEIIFVTNLKVRNTVTKNNIQVSFKGK